MISIVRYKMYFYRMRNRVPIKIIELEQGNYHLLVESVFDDGSRGNWVIDTGASKSVFDRKLAKHCLISAHETEELHSAGASDEPMTTEIAYMEPFLFGKLHIQNMKVALLDMTHINKLYSKVTDIEICGLIGSDFLLRHRAVINYKQKRLVLR